MKQRSLTIRKLFAYAFIASVCISVPQITQAVSYDSLFLNNFPSTFDQFVVTTTKTLEEVSKNIAETKSLAGEVAKDAVLTLSQVKKDIVLSSQVTTKNISKQVATQSASVSSSLNFGLEKIYGFAIDKTTDLFAPFFIKKESTPSPFVINNYDSNKAVTVPATSTPNTSSTPSISKKSPLGTSSTTNTNQVRDAVNLLTYPLVQNILGRLSLLEINSKNVAPQNIQNIFNSYSSGGGSYTIPSDTSRSTSESITSAIEPLSQQITQLLTSSNSNTFSSIVATSTTATSTFAGPISSDGSITASAFYGDGSNLTGITSFSTSTTRGVFSSSATGLEYDDSTGIFSLTSGYNIPLTASTTEWASKVSSQWVTSGLNIYFSTGNVGVGTSSPAGNLDIYDSDNETDLLVSNSGGVGSLRIRSWNDGAGSGVNFDPQTDDGIFYFGRDNTLSKLIVQSGNVGIGTTSPSSQLAIKTSSASTKGITLQAASSQSANLFEILDSSGTQRFNISSSYAMNVNFANGTFSTTSPAFTVKQTALFDSGAAGTVALAIKGRTSQTADLLQWLDVNNNILGVFTASGNLGIGTSTPSAKLAITGTAGMGDIFRIASSTQAELFNIDYQGSVTLGGWGGIIKDGYTVLNDAAAKKRLYVTTADGYGFSFQTQGHMYSLGGFYSATGFVSNPYDGSGITFANAEYLVLKGGAGGAEVRNSTQSQLFRVYNTYTSATNYERGAFSWNNNILSIGTENAGAGSARSLAFMTASTTRMTIDTSGNVGIGTTTPTAQLHNNITSAATKGLIIQGASGQSANLFETQSVNGTIGTRISSDSDLYIVRPGTTNGLLFLNTNGYLNADTYSFRNLAGGSTYMSILSSGYVGIGTSTPSAKLAITGSGTGTGRAFAIADSANQDKFYFLDNGASKFGSVSIDASGNISLDTSNGKISSGGSALLLNSFNIGVSTSAFIAGSAMMYGFANDTNAYNATLDIGLSRGGAGKLYLGNGTLSDYSGTLIAGNVGIGTTTPAFPLDVYSTVSSTQTYGYLNSSGAVGTSGPGANDYSIRAQGRILAQEFNAVSDARLKDVQFDLDSNVALNAINKLQPVSFTWKNNPTGQPVLGFLAQDVELAIPNAVSKLSTQNFVDQRELSYNQIVAVVVGAVKELKKQLDTLKTQFTNVISWFSDSGERFNIKGLVCVDDVCVTKDQFKQMLINSGSVMVLPPAFSVPGPSDTNNSEVQDNNTGTSSEESLESGTSEEKNEEIDSPTTNSSTEDAPTEVESPVSDDLVSEPASSPEPVSTSETSSVQTEETPSPTPTEGSI